MERAPATHARPARKARHRVSKVANARDTIEGFDHDTDIVGLTFGQFSLLDLIDATLEITGPADVTISTWSAGFYDVEAAERFRDSGRLRSIRFVMDIARKQGQASPGDVAAIFGASSIRTMRTHAKFVLIVNETWNVVITSSMNLNLNPRLEQFEMTDDAERVTLFAAVVDALFNELPAGGAVNASGNYVESATPRLFDIDDVRPRHGIEVTSRIKVGVWE